MFYPDKKAVLVERIKKKARLLARGDEQHKEIRPLLILDGGGMRGVLGMGCLAGLQRVGLCDVFDTIIGISAGASNGAYFKAMQSELAITVYTENLTDSRFINFMRPQKIADIDYVIDVFRYNKRLDVQALRANRSKLFAAVTRVDNGVGELIDVANMVDVFNVLRAAMALPVLYNRPVRIGRYRYLDGGVAFPLPIFESISRFNPTDILVILNRTINFKTTPILEKIAALTMLGKFSRGFQDAFLEKEHLFNDGINAIHAARNGDTNLPNISVFCHEKELVNRSTKDPSVLRSEAHAAADEAFSIFS